VSGDGRDIEGVAAGDLENMTLRELAAGPFNYGIEFVGSFDTVAERMGEAHRGRRAEQRLTSSTQPGMSRRETVSNISAYGLCTSGLANRGLIRSSYEYKTFRSTRSLPSASESGRNASVPPRLGSPLHATEVLAHPVGEGHDAEGKWG